jgi:hypothetical protein
MQAPVIVKTIPAQVINEGSAFGPVDLKQFIQSPDGAPLHFNAALADGGGLPQGMICTDDGLLTGIPAKATQGNYEVVIIAQNEAGRVETKFLMVIKPVATGSPNAYADQLKAQVWEALEQNLPVPDLSELYGRPITMLDVYYLLERWAALTIWDAFNLDPAGEKKLLTLEGASPHYRVYDRGSCLVASPKDLFSEERTLADALMTAQAMAREVYRRGWTIEMAGFEKMVRAVWVEVQLLGERFGKSLEILHYDPSFTDIRLYREASKARLNISAKIER